MECLFMITNLNAVRVDKCISHHNLHGKHSPESCCCIATEVIKTVQPFFFKFSTALISSAQTLLYSILDTYAIVYTHWATFTRSKVHRLHCVASFQLKAGHRGARLFSHLIIYTCVWRCHTNLINQLIGYITKTRTANKP